MIDKKSLKRILIIRLGAMGDVLLVSPLLRMINQQYPDVHIDFLVKSSLAPLIQNHPGVRTVYVSDNPIRIQQLNALSRQFQMAQYDYIYDLQGNWRSYYITLRLYKSKVYRFKADRWKRLLLVYFKYNLYQEIIPVPLKYFNTVRNLPLNDDEEGLEFYINEASFKTVQQKFSKAGIKRSVVAIAPGAGRKTKCWLPERFARTGDDLSQRGYDIVLIGGEDDQSICAQVQQLMKETAYNFCNELSLLETGACLKESKLLITNDTGVMHMSAAVKTPIIALFGPTIQHFGFYPFRSTAHVIESMLSCRPCSFHGTRECPKKHFNCMVCIDSQEVIDTAVELLSGTGQ